MASTTRFGKLVQEGLKAGLSRAEAERRARESLFEEDRSTWKESLFKQERQLDVEVEQQPSRLAVGISQQMLAPGTHAGVDALWRDLQRAWEQMFLMLAKTPLNKNLLWLKVMSSGSQKRQISK